MRRSTSELAEHLKSHLPLLAEDSEAHRYEHALEVQLPFLQVLAPGFRFVPITVGTSNFEALSALGVVIGNVLAAAAGEPFLVIASSDMNHYESDDVTRVKDRRAIDQLLALDPRGLYDVVREEAHQHVRIRAGGGDADCGAQAGGNPGGIDSLRHLRRCLRRQGHGRRICGHCGLVILPTYEPHRWSYDCPC